MYIWTDLEKLRLHQDIIRRELQISDELLEQLYTHYYLAMKVSIDEANSYLYHMNLVKEFQNRTQQRITTLQNTFDSLMDAYRTMRKEVDDSYYVMNQLKLL